MLKELQNQATLGLISQHRSTVSSFNRNCTFGTSPKTPPTSEPGQWLQSDLLLPYAISTLNIEMENLSPNTHSTTDAYHAPSQSWSYRVPSPPRFNVPPPPLDRLGIPEIRLDSNGLDFESNGFANVDFLKTVTYDNLITQNAMLDWKYEQRREAQQILPFLWLGPVSAARDSNFLQKNGITMVLAVRNILSAQAKLLGSKAAEALGIESKTVDVAGNQDLIAAFPHAFDIINTHLAEMYKATKDRTALENGSNTSRPPGQVLVFCETGNERSATLVVAYIMAMYSIGCVKAIQLAQAQRFAVSIDDTLKHLLHNYEDMLKAKRDVTQAQARDRDQSLVPAQQSNNIEGLHRSSKRTLDDVYDDMEIDEKDGHEALSEGRRASAPFQE